MTKKILQMLDTRIEIRRSDAFGICDFQITLKDGSDAVITLDLESSIKVLEQLDNGEGIIKKEFSFFQKLKRFFYD